tara:strand:+ start:908 stop:1279 length:372 start_codon:yes stop_codon:yes gene_type:complete
MVVIRRAGNFAEKKNPFYENLKQDAIKIGKQIGNQVKQEAIEIGKQIGNQVKQEAKEIGKQVKEEALDISNVAITEASDATRNKVLGASSKARSYSNIGGKSKTKKKSKNKKKSKTKKRKSPI